MGSVERKEQPEKEEITKWEYLSTFIWADSTTQEAKEYIHKNWPNWKNPPKFAVESLGPTLNHLGEKGWELMHIEPIYPGNNHDVMADLGGVLGPWWTSVYLCVFKRQKPPITNVPEDE